MSAPGTGGSEGVGGSAANAVPDPPYDGGGRWDADGHDVPAYAREPDGEPEWLGPIHERMDQLGHEQRALVDAFQSAAAEYDEDDLNGRVGDDGMIELTDEEAAALAQLSPDDLAALGLSPEDFVGLDAADAELGDELDQLDALYENNPDIFDLIDRSVQSRVAAAEARRDAETALEDREDAFEDLRERLPLLQHEPTARRIVARAQELAGGWDPNLIERPEFVHLIELVALASIAQRATAEQDAQQAAQRQIQIESAAGGGGLGNDDGPTTIDWGKRVVEAAERIRPQI